MHEKHVQKKIGMKSTHAHFILCIPINMVLFFWNFPNLMYLLSFISGPQKGSPTELCLHGNTSKQNARVLQKPINAKFCLKLRNTKSVQLSDIAICFS